LGTRIDCQNHANGLVAQAGGQAYVVSTGDGVVNSAQDGANIQNDARLFAYRCRFDGAARHGVNVRAGAVATLGGNSTGSNVTGAGQNGIHTERGAVVRATNTIIDGCGNDGIRVGGGCHVSAKNSDITNCGRNGVFVTDGGSLDFNGGTIDGCETGMGIFSSSRVSADGASVTNSTEFNIATEGKLSLQNGSVTGSGFGTDLSVQKGSIVQLTGTETSSSTGTAPHANDLSISANTLTSSGIIFADSVET